MKYLLILILLLACGQESGVHTLTHGEAGPAGAPGAAGKAAEPCQVYCDGSKHVTLSCPGSAVQFKVKKCKDLPNAN